MFLRRLDGVAKREPGSRIENGSLKSRAQSFALNVHGDAERLQRHAVCAAARVQDIVLKPSHIFAVSTIEQPVLQSCSTV